MGLPDDHLGVMDHLGIDKFLVMGFCIGDPFIWNLLRRAESRGRGGPGAAGRSRPGARSVLRDQLTEWGPEPDQASSGSRRTWSKVPDPDHQRRTSSSR